LLLNTTAPWKRVLALLTNAQKLALGNNPHGSVPALLDDCLACAVDSIVAERPGGTVRTPQEFEETLAAVRRGVVPRVLEVIELVEPVLVRAREVELGQAGLTSPVVAATRTDLDRQLRALVRPGFVADTGYGRLRHLERYLRAMRVRQDKAPGEVARDAERMAVVHRVEEEHASLLAALPPARRTDADVVELRWMLEELRVSLFAQTLGTAHPVSEKRIYKAMDAVEG
jgi:ATP-dependent helicase HrpA